MNAHGYVIPCTSLRFRKEAKTVCIRYIYKRRASSLPSNFDRAMREASSSKTVTGTDSYAFLISTNNADERKTEAKNFIE